MSKSWDKNILRKLKSLMGRGLSAAEIGKRLGLSKNAIVGKMHRMGWNPKASEDGKSEPVKTTPKKSPAKPVAKKAMKSGVTKKASVKSVVKKSAETTKANVKKAMPKNSAPKKTEKIVAKPTASKVPVSKVAKPAKTKDKKSTKVAKPKTEPKPVVVKKNETVTKSGPRVEQKSEPKPVVGRPIAGRGGAAHQRIVQHALEMASLKPNQCRWPIGDPDSDDFHFCGKTVFVGKPYCYDHCKMAYQFAPPKKK